MCPATSHNFWKGGLRTNNWVQLKLSIARFRHETTWMWKKYDFGCHLPGKRIKMAASGFHPKKQTEQEAAWSIADLIQAFFQSILYHVSNINSNPARSHRSTPNKKHHQPSTFAITIHHDFFSQIFEIGKPSHDCEGSFVCVEACVLPFILLGFCLKGNTWKHVELQSNTRLIPNSQYPPWGPNSSGSSSKGKGGSAAPWPMDVGNAIYSLHASKTTIKDVNCMSVKKYLIYI